LLQCWLSSRENFFFFFSFCSHFKVLPAGPPLVVDLHPMTRAGISTRFGRREEQVVLTK
jgi:hypothetical protein